ncbi:MFS transporter [Aquabacter sediminis]|uniref:MFS transporter n=1 Tax=Aquabacter sediminis TaxID=3029197 RepID=UPI00237E3F7D|nr:MFS transporter [Aquabacter sp. P-9]MDE1570275.1 MFS transporter [Aquabacter sp. P-9]
MTLGAAGRFPVRAAMGLAYGAQFFALGVYLPFFPLWLSARGLSAEDIGLAVAVPLATRLVSTPLLGLLSDRLGRPKALLVLLASFTALTMSLLALAQTLLAILVVLGIAALAWNPGFALLDAYATRQARAGRIDYGRSRLWGSVAFVAANLVGGLVIQQTGPGAVVALMVTGYVSYVAATLALPELARPDATAVPGLDWKQARSILVVGVLAAALIQASHATLYAFSSLHWSRSGLSLTAVGVLWSIGVISEIVVFRFGTRLVRRIGPLGLLMAGAGIGVVRFAGLALDPSLPVLVALQVLHGGTFGATYLGQVQLIARYAPEHRAGSAQSLAAWVVNLTMSGASLASGPLWAMLGPGAFAVSAGLAGLGGVLAFIGVRRARA